MELLPLDQGKYLVGCRDDRLLHVPEIAECALARRRRRSAREFEHDKRMPHELIDVDLMKGAHQAPDFVNLSTFGQVPMLEDAGTTIFDSNVILVYPNVRAWLDRVEALPGFVPFQKTPVGMAA